MSSERIARIVNELLNSAEDAVVEHRWADVISLANDTLDLDPACDDAHRLVELGRRKTGAGLESDPAVAPEHRQVTVLFADQVDSSGFSERYDSEIVRDVTLRFHQIVGRVVRHHGGKVQHHQGDGILACFGYPRAYEDSARRAVQSALEAHAALRQFRDELSDSIGADFDVRIAVHTDTALIADFEEVSVSSPAALSGSIANVAARLQGVAGTSAPVVSAATERLVAGYFELRELGSFPLRGFSRPMTAFEVMGARPVQTRFDASPSLSPLVGRDAELHALQERWARVESKEFAVTALIGEPGVGKSRLAYEMERYVTARGARVLRTACSAEGQAQQLDPVRSMISAVAGFTHDDSHEVRWQKLRDAMTTVVPDPTQQLPILAFMVGIPAVAGFDLPDLHPAALREMTLDTIVDVLHHLAETDPIAVIVEDAHWADPSTVELLGRLAGTAAPTPLWILVTMRPTAGLLQSIDDRVDVTPLSAPDAASLVASLTELPVGDVLIDGIVERSNGVPLYIEELSNAFPAGGPISAAIVTSVPRSLRDLLQARLDTTNRKARRLAQTIATIGADVDLDLLGDVLTELNDVDGTRDDLLSSLADAGIIETVPGRALPAVRFHHVLLRETAYDSQMSADRRIRHGAVATVLARVAPPQDNPYSSVIARHLESAERRPEAFEFCIAAAIQALGHAAYAESLHQLDVALTLLISLPEGVLPQAELGVRLLRAHGLTMLEGYAAESVGDEYERALELCRALIGRPGVERQIAHGLIGLWATRAVAGRLDRTPEVLVEATRVEREADVGDLKPVLHAIRGMDLLFAGHIADARRVFEETLAVSDPSAPPPDGLVLPNCPMVATLATYGLCLVLCDEHDAADRVAAQALERAESLSFPIGPYSAGFARVYRAMSLRWSNRLDESRVEVMEAIAIGERHGFIDWVNTGRIHLAALAAVDSGGPAAVDAFVGAIDFWEAIGGGVFLPSFLVEAARARLAGDESSAAAILLERARGMAMATNQLLVLPDLFLTEAAILGSAGADLAELAAVRSQGYELARAQGNNYLARRLNDANTSR